MTSHSSSLQDLRTHALTAATVERRPTMLCVPSVVRRGVHHTFGVTRDPAAEMLGTTLFAHDLVTLSVSAHDAANARVDTDLAEALACIDRLFGSEVVPMLREVTIVEGAAVTYFNLLVDGDRFYEPSPMQDAFLARTHDARRVMPAPVRI